MPAKITEPTVRRGRVKRGAVWMVIVVGALYSANDGPIPAMFYVLCVGVIYLLVVALRRIVRHTQRSTSGR